MKHILKKRHLLHRILLINAIVMIEQHDTLWSLESQYNNGTEDRDTYINNIKLLNHMSNDTIIDGSYILLYYY